MAPPDVPNHCRRVDLSTVETNVLVLQEGCVIPGKFGLCETHTDMLEPWDISCQSILIRLFLIGLPYLFLVVARFRR